MRTNQFYCVKCRAVVSSMGNEICFTEIKNRKMKTGKMPALKSVCYSCGTNLTKFVKHKDAKKHERDYLRC